MRAPVSMDCAVAALGRAAAALGDAAVRGACSQPAILRFATDTSWTSSWRMLDSRPGAAGRATSRSPRPGAARWRAAGPVDGRAALRAALNRLRLAATARSTAPRRRAAADARSPRAPAGRGAAAQAVPARAPALLPRRRLPRLPRAGPARPRARHRRARSVPPSSCAACIQTAAARRRPTTSTPSSRRARATGWQQRRPIPPTTLAPGEEQLPLFPLSLQRDDGRTAAPATPGWCRSARREAYMGARRAVAAPDDAAAATRRRRPPRRRARFTSARRSPSLEEPDRTGRRGATASRRDSPPPIADEQAPTTYGPRKNSREQIQTMSWYVLLDFVEVPRALPAERLGGRHREQKRGRPRAAAETNARA